jgi:aspartate aminotransferase
MKNQYQERRDYLVGELNDIEGISCRMPEGAFYVFPDISDLFARKADSAEISDSISFCSYILDEARVALVPGKAFGCDNFVRRSNGTH